MVISLQVQ
jgi:hypothetical protein